MRLIDADALKDTICSNVYPVTDYFNSRDYGMFWTGGIEKAIDEQPTIESAQPEIIHCNACKYWKQTCGEMKGFGLGECNSFGIKFVTCYGFCYWAERREDEGSD